MLDNVIIFVDKPLTIVKTSNLKRLIVSLGSRDLLVRSALALARRSVPQKTVILLAKRPEMCKRQTDELTVTFE
jgi:hypothetical protein